MSAPGADRDPIVGHAIAQIEVPEHRPDFWAELEARLGEVPIEVAPSNGTSRVGPAKVLVTYEVPLSTNGRNNVMSSPLGWERRAWWLGAAALLAVVVVVGTVALLRVGDGDETVPAGPPPSTSPPSAPSTTIASSTGASAVEAVDTFLQALARGNTASVSRPALAVAGPIDRSLRALRVVWRP